MAISIVSKAAKKRARCDAPISKENRALLTNYNQLARWDRTFLFMICQALATGRHTPETDEMTWDQLRATSDLPKSRKVVRHG
jgi:hypothetical protein